MFVQMQLSRILIRELIDYQIIELRELADEAGDRPPRTFPIAIGLPEALAIQRRLEGIEVKRPQTHDLLAQVIQAMGGELERIDITDLADHTFFARLSIRTSAGETVHVDSRPSDAIALGVASNTPIFVEDTVIESATRPEEPEDEFADDIEDESPGDPGIFGDDDEEEEPF